VKIKVRYFAVFREERGLGEEVLETTARTPAELYQELQKRHQFRLEESLVRVAINGAYAPWDQALVEADELVLIPPVAGG
jgi:molybdopterin converting factor subunit 1